MADPFDLQRFVDAQAPVFQAVQAELQAGRKRTHWMWFIFPQIDGLGHSAMSRRFAIGSRQEAEAYLRHQTLGGRLVQCCEWLLAQNARAAREIMGSPDDMKLQSSMTLFDAVAPERLIFAKVLDKLYAGHRDTRTLALLNGGAQRRSRRRFTP
jgi:uncharacterized protein (DUF1810 family)